MDKKKYKIYVQKIKNMCVQFFKCTIIILEYTQCAPMIEYGK